MCFVHRTTTDVPLGKVYQTAPGNVAQIISPDQDPSAAGDWGAVADSAGTVRYVPAKDSHGRPYGGAINGAINFRVFDGFSTSDNFGEINFAVDTIYRHEKLLQFLKLQCPQKYLKFGLALF